MVTPILRKMGPQRPHLAGLVVLLFLTFGVTLSLSWAAHRYAREARNQAETALRGWADLAALNFDQHNGNTVHHALQTTFGSLINAVRSQGTAISAEVASRYIDPIPICPCLMEEGRVHYFFRVDLRTGEVDTYGSSPSKRVHDWLRTTVQSVPVAAIRSDGSRGVAFYAGDADGSTRFIGFLRLATSSGDLIAAYGFETDVEVLRTHFEMMWAVAPLLPQVKTANTVNDSLIAIQIQDSNGRVAFASPVQYDTAYTSAVTTGAPLPDLTIRAAVNPGAVGVLIPGGVPRSPVPLIAGLLGLTTMLMLSALFLIRREAELARLRADFIAGVSHELRTPLAQIRMFAETLLLGRVRSDSERTRSLEIIDQEARRLAHLVENVLIFAKSERRKSRIDPQITDLPADVREALQGFAVLCRSRDIEVRAELQENIAAPVDRGALRQILLNLLDNAVKYGPLRQRITVGMALFDSNVRIWVDDEGPGIPVEERERVFERFVRLNRDVEGAAGGSGIGLAIVRELVTLHGGRTWVDDAPGGGARVVFELPGAYVRPDATEGGWAVA